MPRAPRYKPLKNVGSKESPRNLYRTNQATNNGFVVRGLGLHGKWAIRTACHILLVRNAYFEILPEEKASANKLRKMKNSGYLFFDRYVCLTEETCRKEEFPVQIGFDPRSMDRYFYELETGKEVSAEKYAEMLLYKGKLLVKESRDEISEDIVPKVE